MLTLGIVLLALFLILLLVIALTDAIDFDDFLIGFGMGILFIFGIMLVTIATGSDRKSLSKHDLKIDVRVQSVNGVEVSRDTVYIFTPKKK